jgi:hypothetical protein
MELISLIFTGDPIVVDNVGDLRAWLFTAHVDTPLCINEMGMITGARMSRAIGQTEDGVSLPVIVLEAVREDYDDE